MAPTIAHKAINVIVADDHPVVRKMICDTFLRTLSVNRVDQAEDGNQVLTLLRKNKYHLILLDVFMPVMDGIAATISIASQYPEVYIIVFSMADELYIMQQMYAAGCHGYLVKTANEKEIVKAITTVLAGKKYFSTEVLQKIAIGSDDQMVHHLEKNFALKPIEIKIILMIASDRNNKQIAEALNLSVRTIEKYREWIYKKTNVSSTAGIIQFAHRHKLV